MGLNPPESLSDEQVVYWKELVNRVHAAVSATETPDDTPTMEQVEAVAQNIPGADDPHVGFDSLPDGWDRSTVLEVWTKVGGSFTSCKAKFMGEEGWSDRKSDRFCAALKDEVRQSEEWREGGGSSASPFAKIPGVPARPKRVTRDMLESIVRWKMNSLVERARTAASLPPLAQTLNGTVEVAADWNPSLHPRGPDGKFISRPWSMDIGLEDINTTSTHRLVEFLGDVEGEPDMDAVLSDDGIRIDGIPDDVDTVDELKSRINDPQSDMDVPTNPKDFGELGEGDVFRAPDGPREVVTKSRDEQLVTVRRPDGETEVFDFNEQSRSTVDVYDVDAMDDLPSQGGATPDEPPTLDNVTPDDPRFSEPESYKMEAEPGDLIRYEKAAPWGEEQEDMDPKVGELVSLTGTVMEVQPKGEDDTFRFNTGSDGNAFPTGLLSVGGDGDGDAFPDPSDPDGGRWATEGVLSPDEGDMVRFNSPRTMELEVGRVTDEGGMGPATVETADGETFRVSPQPDRENDVYEFKGLFEADEDSLSPDDFPTGDDIRTTNLSELDGPPEARREGTETGEFLSDQTIPAEMVENEDLPVGSFIAKDGYGRGRPAKVTGYTENNQGAKSITVVTSSGNERTLSKYQVRDRDYKPFRPRDDVTVDIDADWNNDDVETRKAAVRDVLDAVTPTGDAAPTENGKAIPDDTFDDAKDKVAEHLAHAKSREHAENVAARLSYIGDEVSRAHARIDQNFHGTPRTNFEIGSQESADTIVHELGHSVGDAYDYRGGSNDMDGKTSPMPSFAWQSPKYDVAQKYSIKPSRDDPEFEDGTGYRSQPMFQTDDWTEDVEASVGTGLDGRNFSNVDSPDDIPAQEGAMFTITGGTFLNEPKQWRITDVEKRTDDFGESELDVEIEARDGTTASGTIEERFDEARLVFDEQGRGSSTGETITGKRSETPDNWRETPENADDWLGTQSFDNADDAMRNLADKVNKAWYRQAVAEREQGGEMAARYAIKSGYSAKQAHETMSRIHEVMRGGDIPHWEQVEQMEAARSLVKFHPDLLEAYRATYEIPPNMKRTLNLVLEQEGHDFRFDDAPDMVNPPGGSPLEDVVDEVYGGAA